jgi:hypothetical protein
MASCSEDYRSESHSQQEEESTQAVGISIGHIQSWGMTMKQFVLVATLLASVAGASAGITDWSAVWIDNSPFNMANTYWEFNAASLNWSLWEDYVAPTIDSSMSYCAGATDEDPALHIIKQVTNNSTFDWTDYHIVITGSTGVGYVPNSGWSDTFLTRVETAPGTLDFYAPNTVPIGATVTFAFDVNLPNGPFTFNIEQSPSPEPASLMLFALSMLLLRRR